jgi:stage V sporulation protein G
MEITEVRIKLMEDSDDRLQAFCSITFDDCFVVRDLKIIDGSNGPFVAMPSRKLTGHCPKCGCKNHLRAAYCNHCGHRLEEERPARDQDGRVKLYADVAHPINATCRELIQQRVIAEFRHELDRAQQPGYVSRYDDDYEECSCPAPPGSINNGSSRPTQQAPTGRAPNEPLPRGPHHPASVRGDFTKPTDRKRSKGEFGAGLFD